MVTGSGTQKRNRPEFAISRVVEIAQSGLVVYGSPRVQNHIDALNYKDTDVHRCLASLTSSHYDHSINYGDHKGWLDVYLISFDAHGNGADDLYIKLKLNRDLITVVLSSFHPEGAI